MKRTSAASNLGTTVKTFSLISITTSEIAAGPSSYMGSVLSQTGFGTSKVLNLSMPLFNHWVVGRIK